MRMESTGLVRCLVSDLSNPFYASVLQAAEAVLAPAGYALLVASTGNQIEREIALVGFPSAQQFPGE